MIYSIWGHIKKIAAAGFFFLLAVNGLFAADSMRRLGIFIGSNNGGRDRIMLR